MKEVDNLLRIFEGTLLALKEEDSVKLKKLSDQTIHVASVEQDLDNIAVAVIVYSLSKIIERKEYRAQKGWKEFYKKIVAEIGKSINSLKKNDGAGFKKNLEEIRKVLSKVSGGLKIYIQDVFKKAKINKASKIYEHGISMEKTASLLGITMFDLASYAGQKVGNGKETKTLGARERIKLATEIFG